MLIPVHRIPGASCKARGRAMALVVAHAIVDDDVAARLAQHFWTLRSGYAARSDGGRVVFMHQDVLGRARGFEISHENANKLDNRRGNLKLVTRSENMLNPEDPVRRTKATCAYRGVTRDDANRPLSRPWRGKVQVRGKTHQTQRFATPEEARDALDELRRSLGLRVRKWPAGFTPPPSKEPKALPMVTS